ncbi:unnamed protein product [Rotaria socialis]|uniref:Uncharacterized protein n=1 Tax=Rotaria socialis TaxID=392032 RepID=A0A817NBJ2_9BILA|nr:unnamed protein product [Rotaria socialis]CAF4450850.1 unnamed protein product [Rotaria socialis]
MKYTNHSKRLQKFRCINDSYLLFPMEVNVDNDGIIYVCDHEAHEEARYKQVETVGTVVAGGKGKGVHLNQLSHPTCIFVDKDHSVYVSGWGNHRVVKWEKNATKGILIAGGTQVSKK